MLKLPFLREMHPLAFLLLFVTTLQLLHRNEAHSTLTDPEPYTHRVCKGLQCKSCPDFPNKSQMINTEANPEVTWSRGENVSISWAKNNHDGGFVRLSLVPVKHLMNESVHDALTLYKGCWEQGQYECQSRFCGSDKKKRVFRRFITIPNVAPDGVYILGYLWYGGIHWKRKLGQFSDYHSCSFVKIEGGNTLNGSYQPFFDAGKIESRFESDPPGKCLTSADRPLDCKTGCDFTPVFYAIPKTFQEGNIPEPITPSTYYDYGVERHRSDERGSDAMPIPEPERAPDTVVPTMPPPFHPIMTQPVDSDMATTPEPFLNPPLSIPEVALLPSPSMQPAPQTEQQGQGMAPGICNGRVCCPLQCSECGGKFCSRRPGGAENCCYNFIASGNRMCGIFSPPCRRW